jgi:hypothetical protein
MRAWAVPIDPTGTHSYMLFSSGFFFFHVSTHSYMLLPAHLNPPAALHADAG